MYSVILFRLSNIAIYIIQTYADKLSRMTYLSHYLYTLQKVTMVFSIRFALYPASVRYRGMHIAEGLLS